MFSTELNSYCSLFRVACGFSMETLRRRRFVICRKCAAMNGDRRAWNPSVSWATVLPSTIQTSSAVLFLAVQPVLSTLLILISLLNALFLRGGFVEYCIVDSFLDFGPYIVCLFASYASPLIMAALCNRGPLYFCPVASFYLLSTYLLSFFIPRLISAATDWMSTILLHMAWP